MSIYGNSVGHPLPDPRKGMTMTGPINMHGQAIKGLNAPTADDEAVNWGSVKELSKTKAGFIYPLASSVVPEGFLLCDGAAYLRSEYPELFAAIGTMYGSGDGSTTFNVPDLIERVPAGAGAYHTTGEMVGAETHKLTVDEMPDHNHAADSDSYFYITQGTKASEVGGMAGGGDFAGSGVESGIRRSTITSAAGGDQPHNNMQPTTFIHGYIIATGKNTAVSVSDIILGVQAIPLAMEYGGLGAADPKTARENLEITPENIGALSAIESEEHPSCFYRIVDGETEWLNPPMVAGVEFRTTERWNGAPVYAKMIACGNIAATMTVQTGLATSEVFGVRANINMSNMLTPHWRPTHGNTLTAWDFWAFTNIGTVNVNAGSSTASGGGKVFANLRYVYIKDVEESVYA